MANSHRFRLSAILFSMICLLVGTGAQAGIGGPFGEYHLAYTGPEALTLFVVPDGSGDSFDRASLPWGGYEDATITMVLKDAGDNPVPNFPREDMWLISADDGLVPCAGGTIADTNTDASGMTHWLAPLHGGGHSQALTEVRVNGSPLEMTVGVRLGFNSPDINGDRSVNLTDVQLFTADYYRAYDFRSDFHRDGLINLSDLSQLAYALGANCP